MRMDCISVENMRLSDENTIANLVPSLELMHRAAYGVYLAHNWTGPAAILSGSGNNGGDGYALACILRQKGIPCTVFSLGSRLSPDSAHYAARAKALEVPVRPFENGCLKGFAEVVDCLLGTGFQGEVRCDYAQAIRQINASEAFVISVDINSGMNGDTGCCALAVKSDLTVTIGYVKRGLVTENAGNYMKKLVCADIGIELVKKEDIIASSDSRQEGDILCPGWLSLDVIVVK